MTDIIKDALEYYDRNTELYEHKFDDGIFLKFIKKTADTEHNIMEMYDKDKKLIYQSRYEMLGILTDDIWEWAWARPLLRKNTTNIIRKIFNYGAELDPEEFLIKTELITSRFKITSYVQIDMHIALASYLSKKPLIYKHYFYESTDEYYKIIHDKESVVFFMFLLD